MKEIELDDWFFTLSACLQAEISGIKLENESEYTEEDYEKFDDAVAEWWDSHDHNEKLGIYEHETI